MKLAPTRAGFLFTLATAHKRPAFWSGMASLFAILAGLPNMTALIVIGIFLLAALPIIIDEIKD